MSLESIYDQDVALRVLRNMLERARVPSGLLFWGPDGIGKRLTALELAKALNCAAHTSDSCGACRSCRKVNDGVHPDVRMIKPMKKSRNIDVETVESINEMASLRPMEGEWRVFIVEDAERMGVPAQNHFLKTLEEPPGRSLFILLTEFPRLLLPTIRSRCQMVRFRALRPSTVTAWLQERYDLPRDAAEAIAELSQGQISRAADLVDSDKRAVALSIPEQLADGANPSELAVDFAKALAEARECLTAAFVATGDRPELDRDERKRLEEEQTSQAEAEARRDLFEYLYLLETWYRDELVLSATGDERYVFNRDKVPELRRGGSSNPSKKLAAIERARHYLNRFINDERIFRDLFFTLAQK